VTGVAVVVENGTRPREAFAHQLGETIEEVGLYSSPGKNQPWRGAAVAVGETPERR